MALPNAGDVQKTVDRIGNSYQLTVPLGDATLAAQDYLGSTTDDAGIPLPSCTLQEARVTLTADDDGNTTIQIDNETKDNQHTFDLDADSYTAETGIGLYFSEDDEISVSVASVTTPGDGLSIVLTFEVEPAPLN